LRNSFGRCESITQKGFDSINQAVSRLVGLESLSLWFLAGFRNHAQIGLKGLSQNFRSLVNLTDLKIQLSEFINFKDEDFSYLKEGLKTLRGVKRISIGFSECEMITDFALSELSEGIIALQGLSSLKLGFFICRNITNEGAKGLTSVVPKMKSLESFYYTLNYCPNITQAGIDELKKGFEEVTELKVEITYHPYYTGRLY